MAETTAAVINSILGTSVTAEAVATTATVATAAASIGTAVVSNKNQREAASDAREANRVSKRVQELRNRRERLKQVASARRVAATAQNRAVAQGVGEGSSAVAGQTASIFTQAGDNIGFIDQIENLGDSIFNARQSQATNLSKAQTLGTASSIFGETLGGNAAIQSLFTPKKD